MTVTDIENILGISDPRIEFILPLAEDFIKRYCNRDDIPTSLELGVAKVVEIELKDHSLQSKSIGNASYTLKQEYPDNVMKILKAHKRLVIV